MRSKSSLRIVSCSITFKLPLNNFVLFVSLWLQTQMDPIRSYEPYFMVIRSLNNDEGDGNEKSKKQ